MLATLVAIPSSPLSIVVVYQTPVGVLFFLGSNLRFRLAAAGNNTHAHRSYAGLVGNREDQVVVCTYMPEMKRPAFV